MRPITCTLLLIAPVLACGKNGKTLPGGIQGKVALARAADCGALTQSVQDTAVRQMRSQMDAILDGTPIATGGGVAVPDSSRGPASYTTTNTQVAGVDEADFVKNDGTRIFVLSGRRLYAATSWPPADLALAGTIDIEGWPESMFLDGDQVVVFSVLWTVPDGGGMGGEPRPLCMMVSGAGCFWGWSTTKITVVEVSNLAAPVVRSEVYLPGRSIGSRRIGSSVRLVLSDEVRWPEALEWWPQLGPTGDPAALAAAIASLEDANEAIIRATPLEKWFPQPQRKLESGATVDVGYQCSDFYLSNAPERLGLVTVATLDLANLDAGISRTSIVGEAGVVYANKEHLFLASPHWWWWRASGERDFTYLHEFDLTDPAQAGYLGSGGVEGRVDDPFSLDEKDGYLRVATSQLSWEEDPAFPGAFRTQVSSRLSVLAPQAGGSLSIVGEIAPLQEGERVMAARFIGDVGYAITFRYVDPLVTLDLSDPAHPRKVAELTLPGFSSYLEPIDGTHLLAIGTDVPLDAAGHPDWTRRALELSLFDVGDLAHPVRSAQLLAGTAWASSEASWDHHAFNWYRPDPARPGLLAIPFSDWVPTAQPWSEGFVSDVRIFSVDPAGSIAPVGSLGMRDAYVEVGSGAWTWWYLPWVRRSVMATDDAGNTFVYAISDAGLRVAPLADLGAPVATALFPRVSY